MTDDSDRARAVQAAVGGMAGVVLAPGVVHLTYFSDDQGRRAWRSSLWRLTGTGRRMYFHQATRVPSESGQA